MGIEVDDNVPLTDEEMAAMFVDLLPDEMPTDDGTAKVSCYLDDSFDKEEIKTKIKNELERKPNNQAQSQNGPSSRSRK